MIVAKARAPVFGLRGETGADARPHLKLDGVALPVSEADGLDARKALERPGQAYRGILPAGEKDQRAVCRTHRVLPFQPAADPLDRFAHVFGRAGVA